jgi:serine/threonine protein kinase
MSTGVKPFRGETQGLIFDFILNRTPVSPVRINSELPAELEAIINKALEKDRNLRYQHASEIRTDLLRLKRDTDSRRISNVPELRPIALASHPQDSVARNAYRRWLGMAATILVLLLIAGTAYWITVHKSSPVGEMKLPRFSEPRRLVSNSPENPISSIAVSPDGKYLSYRDKTGIYLKLLTTGETHQLAWPDHASIRVDGWYPDSAHIVATREDQSAEPSLWRISVFGGSPARLADNARDGRISPDGSQVAFLRSRRSGDQSVSSIWTVQVDGTSETKIVPESEEHSSLGPVAWSPDGTKLAYLRRSWTYSTAEAEIEIADVSGASRRQFWQTIGSPMVYFGCVTAVLSFRLPSKLQMMAIRMLGS